MKGPGRLANGKIWPFSWFARYGNSMLMDDAMTGLPARPRLSDPGSCGEDHGYNLSRVTEIARLHCGDCEQYHVTTPLNRLVGQSGWNGKARKILIEFSQQFLIERRPVASRIDIVIAGAADTSILASCAHAASVAGPDLTNLHFTVLDKCETPLVLCRDFAQIHQLQLVASAVDLTKTAKSYPADLIVMHNTLSFLPPSDRITTLRECVKWLKPDGRLVLWVSLSQETSSQKVQRSIEVGSRIRAMLEAGTLAINEPLAQFTDRLDALVDVPRANPYDFASMADFKHLLAGTKLPIVSIDTFDQSKPQSSQSQTSHVLAVLGPPSSN